MDYSEHPHRRYNPLTGEWVKVSPHRTKRPWQGQVEKSVQKKRPAYDPKCYLCPGNERAGGHKNPHYPKTFAFDNDFAALLPDSPANETIQEGPHNLLQAKSERGICRVICFSPRHDLTLALMPHEDVLGVVQLWTDQYQELGSMDFINHVQIFENRGETMGSSNPHPHGQIWADELIPDIPATELRNQEFYFEEHGSSMLQDYISYEIETGKRIVFENETFAVLVPFWAVWPFEVMVLPKRHVSSLPELTAQEQADLADAVKRLGIRYDNLFKTSFPYSMGIHQAPTDNIVRKGVHLHLHYYPPLLRSATVKKFMVGYEMMAMAQRDITAEQSAQRLREMSETHFTQNPGDSD
ncbi:MAG: UDP-glucose--hexose-1-phosphate uridylyltransferase [Spirochaetia bacterium]|nr:UDP-glucose--hexose-1-phosphate uridylyltransferase [Spirochaetia bacterium]